MKTKYYLLTFFCYLLTFGQSPSIQDNFLSAPSAASVPSYVKSPISISSGIPDIQIPFFTLPTHNKNVSVNTGISYHPNNTERGNKASDLGLGWSMYGTTNLIYQEVNPYTGDAEGDFYYSVMGQGGRFTLYEQSPSNISVHKTTNDKLNITVTKVNGTYNFKIVDPLGTSYFLDIADRLSRVNSSSARTFSTAYYVSRVVDANNIELLTYEYQEDAYTVSSMPGINYPIKSLKVKKIKSPDFGEINLNYTFSELNRKSYTDSFELTSIELKNNAGTIIEKYGFQSTITGFSYPQGYIPVPPTPCLYTEGQSKRILNKVLKYNKNSNSYQTTEFTYSSLNDNQNIWSDTYYPNKPCFDNEPENPKHLGKALLTAVKFPNGTKVMYVYELNQYYVNKNTDFYKTHFAPPYEVKDREAQYFEDVALINFDTNQNSSLFWNLPTNTDNSDGSSYLQYWVNVTEYYPNPLLGENQSPMINVNIPPAQNGKYMPGWNNLTINGTGGRGTITIQRVKYKSMPMANFSTGKGVRINRIEYYDGNTLIPTQTRKYEYQDFNNNAQTSGVISEFDNISVVYKNVKETIGEGNGYTKYYFKTLSDYPQNVDSNGAIKYITELDYYDVLVNGIIAKKETYDNSNILLAKEEHDYEFSQSVTGTGKKSMVKKHSLVGTNNTSSGSITATSESQINTKDLNVIYTKTTGSDGTIRETNMRYAWGHQLEDPKLWNAGITGVPIITETKKNGTVISKTETKFEDVTHFYPTSQISFLPDNLNQSIKNASYDIYDDKGNLVQFTAFPDAGSVGVPTTIIYGYNKTLPISKIEGAKLSDIPSNLITAIVNASNEDANATAVQEDSKEQALIAALNTFKNDPVLQNFMITCYTYNPLIGITTTIPPNGLMEFYKYDSFNRLLKVVDVNGNTVKEHLYNYKN